MTIASIQSRQANESPAPAQKQVARSRPQTSLHEAVTRAFEVAQTIDKAVRVATGESLELFLTRVMSKFFERSEGTWVRIGMTDNIWETFGHLQVHDHALCKGFESETVVFDLDTGSRTVRKDVESHTDGIDCSAYVSGHPIGINVWVESKDEYENVRRCMEECGFRLETPKGLSVSASYDRPFGHACSDPRDRSELNSTSLAKLACLILKNRWGVEEKKEIACFFDHDEVRSCVTLDSEGVLRECLAEVSTREPKNAALWIESENEEISITVERIMPGTLKIWPIADEENLSRMQVIFEEAGYTKNAEDEWLGSEDTDLIASVFENIFHATGITFESNQLRAELHVQRRFV